jgi:hypothetical protein
MLLLQNLHSYVAAAAAETPSLCLRFTPPPPSPSQLLHLLGDSSPPASRIPGRTRPRFTPAGPSLAHGPDQPRAGRARAKDYSQPAPPRRGGSGGPTDRARRGTAWHLRPGSLGLRREGARQGTADHGLCHGETAGVTAEVTAIATAVSRRGATGGGHGGGGGHRGGHGGGHGGWTLTRRGSRRISQRVSWLDTAMVTGVTAGVTAWVTAGVTVGVTAGHVGGACLLRGSCGGHGWTRVTAGVTAGHGAKPRQPFARARSDAPPPHTRRCLWPGVGFCPRRHVGGTAGRAGGQTADHNQTNHSII